MWRLYGWYSALMACGSCVGAVAWTARMIYLANLFTGLNTLSNKAERFSLLALMLKWFSAYLVLYSVDLIFLFAAILMVLDRMSVFAAPQGTRLHKRWAVAGRVIMTVVVLANAIGLVGNIASAVYYQKTWVAYSAASVHYAANNTDKGDELFSLGRKAAQLGGQIASVQRFGEVAVLLLIIVAFVVVGVLSARRVSSSLLEVEAASAAAATGRALRRRMVGTTAFIFVAFLIRSVFSTMTAVAYELRDFDKICPADEKTLYCDKCYNVYMNIVGWLTFTPELDSIVVLISSPLALLIALWGMTPKTMLLLMKTSEEDKAASLKPINCSNTKTESMSPRMQKEI